MPLLEGGYHGDLGQRGQNNLALLREIVAVAIIEAIARQKASRGRQTQPSSSPEERAEHQPGDLVDVWYDPPNKDIPGWKGPAQIVSVNIGEGNVTVRFQARTLNRRHLEVGIHVPYLVYMLALIDSKHKEWSVVRREVENLTSAFVSVGAVNQSGH